jgi:hypothetical protein
MIKSFEDYSDIFHRNFLVGVIDEVFGCVLQVGIQKETLFSVSLELGNDVG